MSERKEIDVSPIQADIPSLEVARAEIEIASPEFQQALKEGEKMYRDGMGTLNELLIGEYAAKRMYIAELAMGAENGMGALVISVPGSGKSRLLKYGPDLIQDIHKQHVANVPHRQDLSPADLVGASSEMVRSGVNQHGEPYSETISGKRVPILRPGIKVVNFDELTRTSPLALNAALEITQNGGIEVQHDGQDAYIEDFDGVFSSMNNHGTMYTNGIDPAGLARLAAMGAFMGVRYEGQLTEAAAGIWDNPNKRYTGAPGVDRVITRQNLEAVRSSIDEVPIYSDERELGKRLEADMLDSIEETGLDLGDARTADQLIRVARTLAIFDGSDRVTKKQLNEAVKYAMTGRIGGSTDLSVTEINDRIKDVTGEQ